MNRCKWCNLNNPKYIEYHDKEWGIPSYDDTYLFEMLLLESFQAGLSWECILNKREYFKESFDNINNNPDGEMHRNIFVSECSCGNVCCYCIYPQQFADALTTGRWSDVTPLFDPVRNDARFLDCVKRVEKLCVSKSAD